MGWACGKMKDKSNLCSYRLIVSSMRLLKIGYWKKIKRFLISSSGSRAFEETCNLFDGVIYASFCR